MKYQIGVNRIRHMQASEDASHVELAGFLARCSQKSEMIECEASTMILLQTKRLLFRSHSAEDEDDFVRMQMDPEVRRYVGGQGWPLEKARDRFRKQYLGRPTRTYGLWATVLKEEERYVGCCGLRPGPERSAHLATTSPGPTGDKGLPRRPRWPSSNWRSTVWACFACWLMLKKAMQHRSTFWLSSDLSV